MKSVTKKSLGIAALVAVAATTAAPAEAQRYRHHRDNDAALAIGAGIIGLGIGAAIASGGRDRYYGDPYYYNYDRPYRYRSGYRGHYSPRYCTTRRVWDPYYGRRVRVRYCR